MQLYLFKGLLISFYLFAFPSIAAKVIFVADHLTPEGDLPKGEIAANVLRKLKQQIIGQIEISYLGVNRENEWKILQSNDDVCVYNRIKTPEREKDATFTVNPIVVFPPPRLIVFGKESVPNSLSLASAIDDYNLQLGRAEGRSYGSQLDKAIELYKMQMIPIIGKHSTTRLKSIFLQQKLDAIIEYVNVFKENLPEDITLPKVTFHQLEEAKAFVYGYIACAKSAAGNKTITAINNALESQVIQAYILEEHRRYFPAAEHSFIESALRERYNTE